MPGRINEWRIYESRNDSYYKSMIDVPLIMWQSRQQAWLYGAVKMSSKMSYRNDYSEYIIKCFDAGDDKSPRRDFEKATGLRSGDVFRFKIETKDVVYTKRFIFEMTNTSDGWKITDLFVIPLTYEDRQILERK